MKNIEKSKNIYEGICFLLSHCNKNERIEIVRKCSDTIFIVADSMIEFLKLECDDTYAKKIICDALVDNEYFEDLIIKLRIIED